MLSSLELVMITATWMSLYEGSLLFTSKLFKAEIGP